MIREAGMIRTGLMLALTGTAFMATATSNPAQAQPHGRTVSCAIETRQTNPYRGPCLFIAGHGGTFTVVHPRGQRLLGDVMSITVNVTAPGVAEVTGSTYGGPTSRWGRASRDRRDRACWVAPRDFRICAY